MNRFSAIAFAVFLIAAGFSNLGRADDDSWLPGFLSDAFKDDLERLGVLRATLKGGVFVELEFKDQKAFFTVVAVKAAGTEPESYSQLKDGFVLGYSQNDGNIYFDSSIELLGTGNLGVLDSEAETIRIDSTLTESSVEFQKVISAPAEGIYKQDSNHVFYGGSSSAWIRAAERMNTAAETDPPWFYWDFDNAKSYGKDDNLRKVIEFDASTTDVSKFRYFTSSTNGFNLYDLAEDITVHAVFALSDSSFKAAMTAEGYDRVSEDEYQIALKQEEERVAAEQAMEEKRLADEREQRRRAEAAAAEIKLEQERVAEQRRLEQERVAEQRRLLALKQKPIDTCIAGKVSEEYAGAGIRRVPAISKKHSRSLSTVASMAIEGRYEDALSALIETYEPDKMNQYEVANYNSSRGTLHGLLGNYAKARHSYQKVLRYKNSIPFAMERSSLLEIARLDLLLQDWSSAVENMLTWCGMPDTEPGIVLGGMARAYFEQGEFELALRSVDGAIKLRGSTETSLRLKAAAAAELNQTNSVSVSITSLVHDYASSSLAPTYASLLGDLSDRSGSIDAQKFTTSLVESLSLDLIEMSRLDGEYLPILKVAPVYPRRAQTRGISGYCTVEYTVTKAGLISNPVAVDCFPEGVFERSSIKAAEQFKYAPRVVNGEPVEVTGVTNKFTYELEN